MHLLRRILVVAAIASTTGCHDTSGPPPLPANYVLARVNGRPLPTFLSPIPESPNILSGTLFLDGAGNAVLTEHRHEMIAPGDITYTSNYTYTIRDSRIEFHFLCPPGALCTEPPVGTFVGSHLFLDLSAGQGSIVYDYQQVVTN